MTVYSFPRMDGQPNRMTTEQLCDEAYARGLEEGKAVGRNEREIQLKEDLAEQLRNSQTALKESVTEELNQHYQARYAAEFENVVNEIKRSEAARFNELSDAVIRIISTVCEQVLDKELSSSTSQSITSVENLLSNLPLSEEIQEIQMGETVYQAWKEIEINQILEISLSCNPALSPTQVRLVSDAHFHEVHYQDRLTSLLSQIKSAFQTDE